MAAWSRVYNRGNQTSTNKIRVCIDAQTAAGLEINDIALVIDGLIRHVKTRDMNAAIALGRVGLQLTWRIASDRYDETGNAFCFIVELAYDEYESLVRIADWLIAFIDARIRYYRDLLLNGSARDAAAVRRKIDAYIFIREVLASLIEYHNTRRNGRRSTRNG